MTTEPDRSFIHTLETEAGRWQEAGIIDQEQKDRILGRYAGLKAAHDGTGPGRLISTISVLGSILVGIGVLLFVASNWSRIPHAGRLAIIFLSLFSAYGAGFFLRSERGSLPRTGEGLILLGSFIFGAGIFLIAQMYNFSVHYPNGPLLWGLAVLPLAYLLGMNTVLALAIIDLLIWLGMEANFSLFVFSRYGSVTVFLALFLLAGITLWAIGLMHRGFSGLRRLAGPYLAVGLFLTFAAGFVLTFDINQAYLGSSALARFYGGSIVLFVSSVLLYVLRGDKGSVWIAEIVYLGGLFLIVLLFCLTRSLPVEGSYADFAADYRIRDEGSRVIRLAFNLLFGVQVIGVIVLGYLRRNRSYVNLGLAFFVLEVSARYFDVFWMLLPRSLFFMCGGAVLIAGGIALERKRRKVLASFPGEAN